VNPARLERAASGVADLRSDPSELRVQTLKSGGGATRTHRGVFAPGGLARRCTSLLCCASVKLAEGAGVEPTGAFAPTVFGTARRARAQPSVDASGGTRTPMLAWSDSFTGCCLTDSASDANAVEKTDEGGERETPRLHPLKVIRLSNSKIKGAGLRASPEEAGPLHASLYELFEIWGAGGRPPLNQFCNCRRSLRAHPSGRRVRL
jgi:hypothetical protein